MTLRLALVCAAAVIVVAGLAAQQTDVDRRLDRLEDLRADARLSAIETRLDALEDVGKGILIAVAVQIVISGLSFRKRG